MANNRDGTVAARMKIHFGKGGKGQGRGVTMATMTQRFGCNRHTVVHALKVIKSEGWTVETREVMGESYYYIKREEEKVDGETNQD